MCEDSAGKPLTKKSDNRCGGRGIVVKWPGGDRADGAGGKPGSQTHFFLDDSVYTSQTFEAELAALFAHPLDPPAADSYTPATDESADDDNHGDLDALSFCDFIDTNDQEDANPQMTTAADQEIGLLGLTDLTCLVPDDDGDLEVPESFQFACLEPLGMERGIMTPATADAKAPSASWTTCTPTPSKRAPTPATKAATMPEAR